MTSIFLILQFVLAGILVIAVLLQKSSSIGLGAYSGSNESLFGAKGTGGFLAKLTFIVALLFVINTLTLVYFYNKNNKESLVDTMEIKPSIPETPTVPSAPKTQETPPTPDAPPAPKTGDVPPPPVKNKLNLPKEGEVPPPPPIKENK